MQGFFTQRSVYTTVKYEKWAVRDIFITYFPLLSENTQLDHLLPNPGIDFSKPVRGANVEAWQWKIVFHLDNTNVIAGFMALAAIL